MIDELHYCSRQGEMKEIKSKFSWAVPLYKLVLGRGNLTMSWGPATHQWKRKSLTARARC